MAKNKIRILSNNKVEDLLQRNKGKFFSCEFIKKTVTLEKFTVERVLKKD